MTKLLSVLILISLILISAAGFAFSDYLRYPSKNFDLLDWKLQIPGPKEISSLTKYSSNYFYLDENNSLCFSLDASEKGHTKNSEYIRSELRHTKNWHITENHELQGELKVISNASPNKVTIMQIHGITENNEHAPPLLRIALNSGDLYAFLKTSNFGEKTDAILLAKNINGNYFKVGIKINNGIMHITVNNEKKLERDISYWKHKNYFKLGCYPQAKKGQIKVIYRQFAVK